MRQQRFKPDNLIPNTRDLSAAHCKLILVQSAINKNLLLLGVLRRTETGESLATIQGVDKLRNASSPGPGGY